MNMIEKIAAAIMASEYSSEDYPYAGAEEGEKNEYRKMARAALTAMLEPSQDMLDASHECPAETKEIYVPMIQAALNPR